MIPISSVTRPEPISARIVIQQAALNASKLANSSLPLPYGQRLDDKAAKARFADATLDASYKHSRIFGEVLTINLNCESRPPRCVTKNRFRSCDPSLMIN